MPTIPHPILHNIRCVRCKKWLSCGPVTLLPNGGSVCGRCEIRKEGPRDQYRHFAFEALACYFKFPCKNWSNNCPEVLPFKNVLAHERQCSYGSTCALFFSHPSAAFKSKRCLDIRAAIKLEIIPDQVLEYLRCGNCAGYMSSSPVLVARDGTSICYRCSAQIQEAPEFIRDLAFETIVDMMIFPCIYRYRGCTQYFKFGDQSLEHEVDCSYGKPYVRQEHLKKEPVKEHQVHKERGIIQTHSGHIYATITPNAPVFAKPTTQFEREMFLDEFQRHRENLANKWGRSDAQSPSADYYQYDDRERCYSPHESYVHDRGNKQARSSINSSDIAPRPSHQRTRNSFSPTDAGRFPLQREGLCMPADNLSRQSPKGRSNSLYETAGYGRELIGELKHKQLARSSGDVVERRNSGLEDKAYYVRKKERRMANYKVYS